MANREGKSHERLGREVYNIPQKFRKSYRTVTC